MTRGPGSRPWDLVVVGGGTAGIVAARTAAGTGADVLLIERDRTGGDCLWTGCVPSKTLLSIAHEVAAVRRGSPRAGVPGVSAVPDPAAVWASVQAAIAEIESDDSPETLRAAGLSVVHGTARFTGPRTIVVDDGRDGGAIDFVNAVIATGSRPVVPPVPGLDPGTVLTSDTLWTMTGLPDRLLVLGGGSIGCELGQAFARLGVTVSIVEQSDRLLSTEEEAASRAVTAALVADGVDVRTGVGVDRAEATTLRLRDGSLLRGDAVLVAAGREPVLDGLGLGLAGVRTTARDGVGVDARLRTSNPRIWAAGDVTDHPRFTHVAGLHGSTVALNAVLGLHRRAETTVIPRVTYTRPEVAAFGPAVADAQRLGLTVRTLGHDEVDRAVTEDDTTGHTTLLLDRRGKVAGASLVGPRAGETLAELTLAAREKLSFRSLAGTVHAYPTWGDGVWNAALAGLRADLERPVVRRGVRGLLAVRRTVLGRRG